MDCQIEHIAVIEHAKGGLSWLEWYFQIHDSPGVSDSDSPGQVRLMDSTLKHRIQKAVFRLVCPKALMLLWSPTRSPMGPDIPTELVKTDGNCVAEAERWCLSDGPRGTLSESQDVHLVQSSSGLKAEESPCQETAEKT